MARDTDKLVPIALALLMHVILIGSLIVAFNFSRKVQPAMPLAIKATLVTDGAVVLPPKREPVPEPVPDPEPELVEPDPVEEIRRLEEIKRAEDQRIEQERQQRIEQQKEQQQQRQAEAQRKAEAEAEAKRKAEAEAEAKRKAEAEAEAKRKADAEAKRKAEEEAQRKAEQEEAEKERKRVEAEEQRQRDIERQREQNRLEQERLETQQRQEEINAEAELIAAQNSNEMTAYIFAIQQKVRRNWVQPASATPDLECIVRVRQRAGGEVVGANVISCNGDAAVVRSIEAAVHKASPLPEPANPILFDTDLRFVFKPEQ